MSKKGAERAASAAHQAYRQKGLTERLQATAVAESELLGGALSQAQGAFFTACWLLADPLTAGLAIHYLASYTYLPAILPPSLYWGIVGAVAVLLSMSQFEIEYRWGEMEAHERGLNALFLLLNVVANGWGIRLLIGTALTMQQMLLATAVIGTLSFYLQSRAMKYAFASWGARLKKRGRKRGSEPPAGASRPPIPPAPPTRTSTLGGSNRGR